MSLTERHNEVYDDNDILYRLIVIRIDIGTRQLLISVSKDTLLKVWDIDTQQCIQTIVGHRCEIWSVTTIGVTATDVRGETATDLSTPNSLSYTVITGSSDDQLRGYTVNTSLLSANTNEVEKEEENILTYIGSISTACGTDKVVRLCTNPSDHNTLAAQSTGKVIEVNVCLYTFSPLICIPLYFPSYFPSLFSLIFPLISPYFRLSFSIFGPRLK